MLVFGDRSERVDPQERLAAIAQQLGAAARMRPGVERHAVLVGALIETGRLQQGLADAAFSEAREDRPDPAAAELGSFLRDIAAAVCRSWDSQFGEVGPPPAVRQLGQAGSTLELRTPEGFAFYAVYPEAYIEAARRLRLVAPARVIGIRSIGTTLAAVVAAALDAPVPITVRPFGDPFARSIAIAPELQRDLLATDAHFVIVDEGPGLSGSSFGAVADWLQERGVPLERIAFLPSHAGALGPQASEAHRRRWSTAQRLPAELDLRRLLARWAATLIEALDGPLTDVSGGAWRRYRCADASHWPAVNPAWERRKFLASAGGARFQLKFAGLGAIGECKLTMARALHAAGFAVEPVGLVHGFLIERWCEQVQPLVRGDKPVAEIARYIGARARLFPAKPSSGASLGELSAMCRRNISLALGEQAAELVARLEPRLDRLSRRVVRVRTDNRLLPHEWLRSSDRLLKTDAVDHHTGHDLIGCQDIAWDAAGAIVEFDLTSAEAAQLIDAVELSAGRRVDPELLQFYRLAYLAFRLGQETLSAEACADRAEIDRSRHAATRYCHELEQLLLESTRGATRQKSSVG